MSCSESHISNNACYFEPSGNERGMLEDTISALRALRTWKVRVLLEEDLKHSCITAIDVLSRVVFLSLPKVQKIFYFTVSPGSN